MTCEECGKEIRQYPCICGYGVAPSTVLHPRMVRETFRLLEDGITKDTFGLHLYETIKTIGGLMAIDEHRAVAIYKSQGYKLQGLNQRRLALQQHLATQLPFIGEQDMKELIQHYPQVTGY